jgi:hypothetical protein
MSFFENFNNLLLKNGFSLREYSNLGQFEVID